MLGCWEAQHVDLSLSIRESLLRGESWVERKEEEEGRGGRFWAREELLRSCEELGKV